MSTKAQNIETRQTFHWLLVSELEMAPPQWGRPLSKADVRAIATAFDPDKLGAIAVWHRPDLPIGRGRYVTLDGQHRVAAVRFMGYSDQRVPCLVYEGLTMETAAELSMGLQERRNLHPLDKHRAMLAAHERRATEIDKVLQAVGLELAYSVKGDSRGRLSAVSQLSNVWDCMGVAGLERVLTVCGQAWDRTCAGYASNVLRLVMTIMQAHNGQVDDVHLGETLSQRSPGQWLAKDVVPRRSLPSLAQDVILEYNKKLRGGLRLNELTPSQYERAVKRPPSPTKRGTINVETATVSGRGSRSRRRPQQHVPT